MPSFDHSKTKFTTDEYGSSTKTIIWIIANTWFKWWEETEWQRAEWWEGFDRGEGGGGGACVSRPRRAPRLESRPVFFFSFVLHFWVGGFLVIFLNAFSRIRPSRNRDGTELQLEVDRPSVRGNQVPSGPVDRAPTRGGATGSGTADPARKGPAPVAGTRRHRPLRCPTVFITFEKKEEEKGTWRKSIKSMWAAEIAHRAPFQLSTAKLHQKRIDRRTILVKRSSSSSD